MLIGSWWRLEWYIVHSGKIPQISPTFGKIPRKFPEKFGNLVKISGIQSKFREFSQDFGNLNGIFQWISWKFQWFEHSSKSLKYYWILQFTEILWNSSDSHWNSQPSHLCIEGQVCSLKTVTETRILSGSRVICKLFMYSYLSKK